ncbi:MAG: hypothetical protein HYV29_14590 [Ignavibacteriales bacterium]|nr:hypothetical protein [Ignavibacteriales bacterium]
MGRTTPTATMLIQFEESSWSQFRRALRKEDQNIFDQLFTYAKINLPAISIQARPVPFESILLSMLIEQQKQISILTDKLRNYGENI